MADMQARRHEERTKIDSYEPDAESEFEGSLEALEGIWRGRVRIAADFDELPDDLAELLGGRS